MSVVATILTYNRLEFLKEIIEAVKNQTRKPDGIIVINNSSTDGTREWLQTQDGITVIEQENLGSSGGQWRAFNEAYKAGYDWVWTMDDDVVPANDCLEKMFDNDDVNVIRTPLRYMHDGKPFFNDVLTMNLSNPFSSLWNDIYSEKNLKEQKTEAIGITFEGPLFHRSLIDRIGLPEKDFFIYGDDTEFFIRAWKAGFKIFVYRDATMKRKLPYVSIPSEFNWKSYYMIRNIIAIDTLNANRIVRYLRPFGYLLSWLGRIRRPADIKTVFKAFFDGYFFKSNR
jgi:GT2 family glycosyltransferase